MATHGTKVLVLGGESYTSGRADDPSLVHILDTSAFSGRASWNTHPRRLITDAVYAALLAQPRSSTLPIRALLLNSSSTRRIR